jgi:hypothetical protein
MIHSTQYGSHILKKILFCWHKEKCNLHYFNFISSKYTVPLFSKNDSLSSHHFVQFLPNFLFIIIAFPYSYFHCSTSLFPSWQIWLNFYLSPALAEGGGEAITPPHPCMCNFLRWMEIIFNGKWDITWNCLIRC